MGNKCACETYELYNKTNNIYIAGFSKHKTQVLRTKYNVNFINNYFEDYKSLFVVTFDILKDKWEIIGRMCPAPAKILVYVKEKDFIEAIEWKNTSPIGEYVELTRSFEFIEKSVDEYIKYFLNE